MPAVGPFSLEGDSESFVFEGGEGDDDTGFVFGAINAEAGGKIKGEEDEDEGKIIGTVETGGPMEG